MITNETKSIINKEIENLFQRVEEAIITGVTETMSPNDREYYDQLDKGWADALSFIADKIDTYQGEV